MSDADKLIEAVAKAVCVQNLVSTRQPQDAATIDAYWRSFVPEARAALAAVEAAGWVLVPVEPTIKMCDAAMELSENPSRTGWRYVPKAPGDAWRMMLSARPRITGETE